MIAPATPLDCGHPMTNRDAASPSDGPTGTGTGRAIDADGRTYCYPCAGDREVAQMATAGAYLAYDTGKPELTTWTGRTLARVTSRTIGRGGFGSRVVYLRAVAPDGSRWYGRHSADWCECVTLHRCKGASA
jgi:hypothetical protein